ncbi:hypothetical protein BH09PSE5_BH09PSE5_50180 [soil metagenome]
MSRSSLLILAVLVGATLSMPADAQWKWRDKSGRVQYSDLPPPPGVPEQDILQHPPTTRRNVSPPTAPASPAASNPLSPATSKGEPELEAKRKAVEQEQAAKLKAEEDKNAALRAANCTKAKGQMKALEDGIRMARTNEKGEREVLDDNARAEEMTRTRAIMASDCK